jgi:regulator of protease activity HflC (stomatin/prohibitin superfamily)
MADHAPRVINLNFNRPSAGQIASIVIGALLIVLLIAVLLTSYYTVEAESEGVVLRFGKFLETVEPGLHFKMPFGIDVVTVVPIRRQLKLEFGFATPGYTANPIQAGQDPDAEKSMVTGDHRRPEGVSLRCAQSRGNLSAICRRPLFKLIEPRDWFAVLKQIVLPDRGWIS